MNQYHSQEAHTNRRSAKLWNVLGIWRCLLLLCSTKINLLTFLRVKSSRENAKLMGQRSECEAPGIRGSTGLFWPIKKTKQNKKHHDFGPGARLAVYRAPRNKTVIWRQEWMGARAGHEKARKTHGASSIKHFLFKVMGGLQGHVWTAPSTVPDI